MKNLTMQQLDSAFSPSCLTSDWEPFSHMNRKKGERTPKEIKRLVTNFEKTLQNA